MQEVPMNQNNRVILKLHRMMGEQAAGKLIDELMVELSIPDLETPANRRRFGEGLVRRGGAYEVLGRSIQVQAELQGAKSAV
jgi:hypothetical protein